MKNIDEESLLKIEEDIEQTNEGIYIKCCSFKISQIAQAEIRHRVGVKVLKKFYSNPDQAKRNKPDTVNLLPQPIISKIDQSPQILTTQISQQAQIIQVNTTTVQNVPQNDPYGNRKIVPKIPTSYPKVVQSGIYPGFNTYIQSENTSGILVPGKAKFLSNAQADFIAQVELFLSR